MLNFVPEGIKQTAFVRLFGLAKIPLIWFIRPSVLELNERETRIKIPFVRKNKNHLGSMYFGVLCAAADIAGGLAAMEHIKNSGKKISLSFKDFNAEFHKRAEGDTIFLNTQGPEIKAFIEKVIASGERENMTVDVEARTPDQFGDEPVATFKLTLSCKLKS
ncbi:MAG: PaaI family thioesterase [Bdellovibrionota bacterium]|jgi:acyl-coenzyme A thioesterase PaaI-like protein|nr:PaaI family thioesterase [Bdellovibrionota bacterium]